MVFCTCPLLLKSSILTKEAGLKSKRRDTKKELLIVSMRSKVVLWFLHNLVLRIQTKDNGFARSMRTFYSLLRIDKSLLKSKRRDTKSILLFKIEDFNKPCIPCAARLRKLLAQPCFTYSNKRYKKGHVQKTNAQP